MKKAIRLAVLLGAATFLAIWLVSERIPRPTAAASAVNPPSPIQGIYSGKLQTGFFTGFFTLAGFILSLKTAILLRLEHDLFGSDQYAARVKNASDLDGRKRGRYDPLISLGNFLIWTVLVCLATSVVQVTVGLIPRDWAVAICFASVAAALVFVFFSWNAIRINLNIWFALLRDKDKSQ